MVKVIINKELNKQIEKKFKGESIKVLEHILSLEKNPHKGKNITNIANISLKELKYKKFRFYFITDGRILKFGSKEELLNLIIRFIAMSEKKDQQKIINKIKETLKTEDFEKIN